MASLDGLPSDILLNIRQSIYDCMSALNSRNFNPNIYPWTCLADKYSMSKPIGERRAAKTKFEALEDWQKICEQNPGLYINVRDVQTYIREEERGSEEEAERRAEKGETRLGSGGGVEKERVVEAFVKLEVSGLPGIMNSVSRKVLSMFELRCINGEWVCVGESTADGMGDLDDVGVGDGMGF